MKISPHADYPVRVIEQAWEEEPDRAYLYHGVFTMTLNHVVDIAFVPDVSATAPPWDGRQLPASTDEIAAVAQARIAAAMLPRYAVTPNEARAGDVERAQWPATGGDANRAMIRYVRQEEFDRFATDLRHLSTVVSEKFIGTTVSGLRQFPVIQFVEREVVAAPWLAPDDAAMLGRVDPPAGAP
jgi:hypothetical protein